jgi:hypothetical protein
MNLFMKMFLAIAILASSVNASRIMKNNITQIHETIPQFLDRLYKNCTYNVDRMCLYDSKVEGSYNECISFKMVDCFVNAEPPTDSDDRDLFRLACIDVMEKICYDQVLFQDNSADSYFYCVRQFVESCNVEQPVLCNSTQYQKIFKGCLDFCNKYTTTKYDDDYAQQDKEDCIWSCNEPCKENR